MMSRKEFEVSTLMADTLDSQAAAFAQLLELSGNVSARGYNCAYDARHAHTSDDEGRSDDLARLSASERVAMMWQLALQAWMFKEGRVDEPRLRRDVVRTLRGQR